MSSQETTQEDAQTFKKQFFEGMSFAATTVNVVTTDGPAGRAGVTVSAMSSVSADTPRPTLLICINEKSAAATTILKNGVFCVNVLRDHQSFISDTFAGRYKDQLKDKFECTEWTMGELGVPRVADALVAFDCRIISTQKIGTHYVCFGEVEDVAIGHNGSALIYANRAYGASSKIDTPQFQQSAIPSTGAPLRLGCFHTFAPFIIPKLTAELRLANPDLSIELIEGDVRRLTEGLLASEIDLAFFYLNGGHAGIEVTPLFNLEPYVLLAENHPLAKKAEIAPADLENEAMISAQDPAGRNMLEGPMREAGIEPKVVFRSSSFEMLRGMVGHNQGFSILMTKPASSITYDGMSVIARPLATNATPGRVGLATNENAALSQSVSVVKNIAVRLFAQPN